MKYDLKLFKKGKHYIKLESQEQWAEVMQWLGDNDVKWASGLRANSISRNWYANYDNTAIRYSDGVRYAREKVFIERGYTKLKESKMKTREEIRNWLLENAVDDDGDLILNGLDFSDFEGDVYISNMKVKGNLYQNEYEVQRNLHQSKHRVQGYLYQDDHEVQGDLTQSNHEVKGNLIQSNHEVKGNLLQGNQSIQGYIYQDCQKVKGDLFQGNHYVKSDLYNMGSECGGNIYESPSTKLLKEITEEELAEMGYKL